MIFSVHLASLLFLLPAFVHAQEWEIPVAKKVVVAHPISANDLRVDVKFVRADQKLGGKTFKQYRIEIEIDDILFSGMKDKHEVYFDYDHVHKKGLLEAIRIEAFAFTANNRGTTPGKLYLKYQTDVSRIDPEQGVEIKLKVWDGSYQSLGFYKP